MLLLFLLSHIYVSKEKVKSYYIKKIILKIYQDFFVNLAGVYLILLITQNLRISTIKPIDIFLIYCINQIKHVGCNLHKNSSSGVIY